jgi:hypothetical protein
MPITTGNTPKALTGDRMGWMQPEGKGSTVVKHPGALHKALGVPEGEKIPAKKMAAGAKSTSPKIRKMVGLAHAFAGANHNSGGCAHHDGGKMAHPCTGR